MRRDSRYDLTALGARPGPQSPRLALAAVLGGLVAACGTAGAPGGAGSGSGGPTPRVSAEATLLPDGAVPWVEEPAGLREFDLPSPSMPSAGDARPCQAEQLRATLPTWYGKGDGGGEKARRPPPGLYGLVQVSSTRPEPCTLQGRVPVRLRIAGKAAPVRYSDTIHRDAEARVTVVTRQSPAELRVDWSPPYCGGKGAQALAVTLPDDGGTLVAPVLRPRVPLCFNAASEDDRGYRSYLSSSGFTPAGRPTPPSPFRGLVATAVSSPSTVVPGERVELRVALSNPSARPVRLRPCPGALVERFVLGSGDRAGFNTSQVYRLNCRPVAAIPARGRVVFQVMVDVPQDPPGGPTMSVLWRLVAPGLSGQRLQVAFSPKVVYS